jgi:uncharacterized membrane protein
MTNEEKVSMSKPNPVGHHSKKAVVVTNGRSKITPLTIVIAAMVVCITAGIAVHISGAGRPSSGGVASGAAVATSGGLSSQVKYPVDMFADGKARHFEFNTDGLTIRYFVLRSSDGVIRAAFDACDVCWPAGKGYYQDSDDMVCRNCGRRFASELVNEVQGGCNPAPLTRKVEGDQLIINADDIRLGKSYFNFKGNA